MMTPWLSDVYYCRRRDEVLPYAAGKPGPVQPCGLSWCAALGDGLGGVPRLRRVTRPAMARNEQGVLRYTGLNVEEVVRETLPVRCVVHRQCPDWRPRRRRNPHLGWPALPPTWVRERRRKARAA